MRDWTPEQLELYEERAAILEYCNGLPRAEAERKARKIVEGRGAEAEQVEMDLGRMEFRQQMRRIWSDY